MPRCDCTLQVWAQDIPQILSRAAGAVLVGAWVLGTAGGAITGPTLAALGLAVAFAG
jgi:hypothetical protein